MKPFISIVTLNYNGKKFLYDFFKSALEVDYPEEKYEIIMVDNNSSDGSVEYVEKNFSEVKIIDAGANLGFGKGNNLGIKAAQKDLVFVINNDTALTKDSLKKVAHCFTKASRKEKIGAITVKLVLIDSYLPLRIEEAYYSDSGCPKRAKPINEPALVLPQETSNKYIEKILLPVSNSYEDKLTFKLGLKPFRKKDFKIFLNEKLIREESFDKLGEEKNITITLSKKDLLKNRTDLIQNAGNFYFRDGYGRDRGAIIYKHRQFFEEDRGQYDEKEFVQGFCGAGVVLNKKALKKVGYFDPDFFLYYEDSELSFRLRENGWKILYCPDSVVRHIHSATNKEWSDLFVYNVERGRLLFLAKHWPRAIALKEWVKYIFINTVGVFARDFLKSGQKKAFGRLLLRLRVSLSLLMPFSRSLLKSKRMSYDEVSELK